MGIKKIVAVIHVPIILMVIAGAVGVLAVVMTRDRELKQPASQLVALDLELATAYPEWVGRVSAVNLEQYRIAACSMTGRLMIEGVPEDAIAEASAFVLYEGIPQGSDLAGLVEGIRGWGYLFTRFKCDDPSSWAQVNATGAWLTVFGPEWVEQWAEEVGYPLVDVEK